MEKLNSKYTSVMVIEDNPIDLFIIKEILKKNNFADQIITFEDAKEAFNYIQSIAIPESYPEIIFTDINLGETTGFDFIDLFLTLPITKTNHIKIIVVSSSIDPRDLTKINSYGIAIKFKEKFMDQNFLSKI